MEITVVCVPYQLDVARWAYALGPQAFLDQGLVQQLRARGHEVAEPIWIDLPREERTRDTVTNLGRIAARTAAAVRAALADSERLAVVLEGDCSHAVGVIGGVAQAAGRAGVVWLDAHGDLNTMATTTTGYIGGMPYAVALGWDLDDWRLAAGLEPPVRAEAAALLGTSDLDPAEREALTRYALLHIPADNLIDASTADWVQAALQLRAREATSWYLHIDLDVAGPEEAPGGLTPAPYWPPRERLIEAVGAAARAVPVRALALATYNPSGDKTGRGAQLGLDLALAAIAGVTSARGDGATA
jgi:arginase